MNITEHLKKDYWVRRVYPDRINFPQSFSSTRYKQPSTVELGHANIYLTQDNLMDEVTPTAHAIFAE